MGAFSYYLTGFCYTYILIVLTVFGRVAIAFCILLGEFIK